MDIYHMTTVAQLLAQKAALEVQIEAARKAENAEAIAKVKALVTEHGLNQQDIFIGAKRGRKASGSVAPQINKINDQTTHTHYQRFLK